MKILLCGSAGGPAGMAVRSRQKAASQRGLAAGRETVGMKMFTRKIAGYSCCLHGAKSKYKLAAVERNTQEYKNPVAVINRVSAIKTRNYGMLNREKFPASAPALINADKGA